MKRKIFNFFISFMFVFVSVCGFVACDRGTIQAEVVESSETLVVIKIEKTDGVATLLDAMNDLQETEKISFVIASGMVTSINGKENNTVSLSEGYSWMLYTSDEANANTTWGTCEYDGKVYGSAAAGANSLKVVQGAYYIWSYDKWSF